jgi:UDP-glucose 4-epimerase
MNIFIAGGAGFIGSHVTEKLLEKGHNVMAYDSYVSGKRRNLPDHNNLIIVEADILDETALYRAMHLFKPDIVIHSFVEPVQLHNEISEIDTNILGTFYLRAAAEEVCASHMIYFQTGLIYGVTDAHPIPITHLLNPNNSYSATKLAGEFLLKLSSIPLTILRFSSILGPRCLTGAPAIFFNNITSNTPSKVAEARRCLVYVKEIADLVSRICEEPHAGIFNVSGRGRDYAIEEIYKTMCSILGVDVPYTLHQDQHSAMSQMLLDDDYIDFIYGWNPTTSLRKILEPTIAWFQKYGVPHTHTHFRPQ